jgi:hypothetical protein
LHTVEHANEDYEEITTSEVQDILNQRVVHNYEDYENLEFKCAEFILDLHTNRYVTGKIIT